jgi:nucleoside 2-deoxyribosyltransferase
MLCAIWGTTAEVLVNAGHYRVYDSPRAGGKYWISGTAQAITNTFTENAKRLLTTWLCQQRRAGVDEPKVDSDVLEIVKARQPLLFMEKFTAALRCLGGQIAQLGDHISLGDENDRHTLLFLAETESKSSQELMELMRLLQETGFVEGEFFLGGSGYFRPTARGWEELDRLRRPRVDSSQAFVAMWFSDETNEAYLKGIAPAIIAAGYRPMRIDQKDHINKIDDEIVAEIRRSRFVVADFTCESEKVRGGVYFEAGYALGRDIPVIWTCKETSLSDLHFDTRQYAHIVWKDPNDLYTQLRNRIGATIGDGPLARPIS